MSSPGPEGSTPADPQAELRQLWMTHDALVSVLAEARRQGILRTCDTGSCSRLATHARWIHEAVLFSCDIHAGPDDRENSHWTPVARRLAAMLPEES